MGEEVLMLRIEIDRQSRVMLARLTSLLAVVAAIACASGCSFILGDELSRKYCATHPADEDCRRTFQDAGECTASSQCSSPKAVCALDKMLCVQCTAAEHGACVANTPVCGDDDACRKCAAHNECPSNACLPDGSCGDDTNVAYVDPSGTSTTCTKASPCRKVSDALKTTRLYVKLQGATNEQVTLNNTNVTLLADPGAKLTDTVNGILLKIDGTSQVAIYDLEISGASGANNPGISVQPGSTATVTIVRAKLSGNAGAGISVNGGTATISESTITGNTGSGISMSNGILTVTQSTLTTNTAGGISTSGGTLTVSRSSVFANNGGGISTNASTFTIMNNFVYRNGNTTMATAGGVGVVGIVDSSKLEFNTIVDNLAGGGATNVGGVLCDRSGFTAANNLIFRNTGGVSGNVQTLGLCTYGNSFVSAGTSTVDNTPMFAHPNSAPFDYHLTPTSPNTIVDAAGTCSGVDYDGDTRPVGPACDLGADERKP
jgi:hypothetical protein